MSASIHYRACNLCEAVCGLQITVEDGRVADLRGDRQDPFSKGAICPKATALIDLHADPGRLRTPVRRTASGWEAISWDDAFDLTVRSLRDVEARHGADAIATYLGNPNVHNSGTMLSLGAFLRSIKTRNRYSATSVDQLPHHIAATEMFGHPMLIPIPDVDRTEFFLVMGANPLVSNGSIMTAPGMRERLRAIRERGGRVVVIDPRRTETASAADEHHFIRPNADAAFLLAMIDTIFSEGLADLGRLGAFIDGADELRTEAAAYPAERVAAHTGIAAQEIRRIARAFARAERAVAYGRVGLSMQRFGGLCQWLINALNAITGNLDEPGGMMWTTPAFDPLLGAKAGEAYAGRWRSRVLGLPEFNGELPVAALVEEMETPGRGQVRALVTSAGNPVLSTPDGARLERAVEQLEFFVAVDPFINETTRHADVILPPAMGLESDHYDVVFHQFAVRNTARYNAAIFPIAEDARYDWQIFNALAERLSGKPAAPPEERLEMGLRAGPRKTSIAELRSQPHGVDYGPLESRMPGRLLTASGRIALVPQRFREDLARLSASLDEPAAPFVLIGRRTLRSNNSWMNGIERLNRGADRCTLMMHPDDASAIGAESGTMVAISGASGRIVAPVQIEPGIMRGVVSLPHGFARANINELTGGPIDNATGNAAFSGVPCAIAVAEAVPSA